MQTKSVPIRRRLPDERSAITRTLKIEGGHTAYVTVGMFEDGTPGEIFIKMAKKGSTISGLTDNIATQTSIQLQYGIPLKMLVKKFAGVRFEPSGLTKNPCIPETSSIIDYVFRWLGIMFLTPEELKEIGVQTKCDGCEQAGICKSRSLRPPVTYANIPPTQLK